MSPQSYPQDMGINYRSTNNQLFDKGIFSTKRKYNRAHGCRTHFRDGLTLYQEASTS